MEVVRGRQDRKKRTEDPLHDSCKREAETANEVEHSVEKHDVNKTRTRRASAGRPRRCLSGNSTIRVAMMMILDCETCW